MKKLIFSVLVMSMFLFTSCEKKESSAQPTSTTSVAVQPTEEISTPTKTEVVEEIASTTAPTETTIEHYILPTSGSLLLSIEDIYYFDEFTLKLAKNEIFARKGYVFKDPDLQAYFSNMSWYVPNTAVKGTFDELNEIEQQNVKLIDDFTKNGVSSPEDFYEIITVDEQTCHVYHLNYDLDGDGNKEAINTYRTTKLKVEIIGKNGQSHWVYSENHQPNDTINIADFDVRDELVQFYINTDGPSGDPLTQIYSFNGNEIVENTGFAGHVTSYDGLGKIYSYDVYNVNCYYDLNNGLTPLPKENIVGTTITYDHNIELFDEPFTQTTYVITALNLTEPGYIYEGKFKENYVGVVPANTPLVVTDIEWEKWPSGEYFQVPWLKVKTPDGLEGWFTLGYGD